MITVIAATTLVASPASAALGSGDFYAISTYEGTLRLVSGGTTTDTNPGAFAARQLFLDDQDNLFIADQGGGRVLEVPADGGATITRASDLNQPSGVVVDSSDNLYVAEYEGRVLKYPAGGGDPITLATLPRAYEMAIDDAGTLYVPSVDSSNAIYTVQTDGSGHSLFSSAIESPTGVALGADGYLYVTDYNAGTLSRMPLTDGNAVEVVASGLATPTGIDFGRDGNLYLAEASADRILSFEDGQGTGTAVTSGLSNPWGVAAAGDVLGLSAQTVAFTSTAPVPAAIGGTYVPTATGGGSGNPVTFSVDPATTNGACTIDAGTVTFAHAGACVIAADQDGDADHADADSVTQSITVAQDAQTVAFTSNAPAPGSLGGTYAPTATGGGSGNPVTFSVDPATTNGACTIDAGTVTFAHAGACVIAADQAGDADHAAGHATQSITVAQGAQSVAFTSAAPGSAHVNDTYAPKADGGTSGQAVRFDVTGPCAVDRGTVTFTDTGLCTITASQAGGPDHTDAPPVTQAVTVVRSHPTITAHLSSPGGKTRFGWYGRKVTITYTCDADGSILIGACPSPVTVNGSGEDRTRVRTIRTADGAVARATTVVDLDKVRPEAIATHVRGGKTYHFVPKVGCKATDGLSGVRRCGVRQWVVDHGTRLHYRVVAIDKAGKRRVVTGNVRLSLPRDAYRLP